MPLDAGTPPSSAGAARGRADYGLDAPAVIAWLLGAGSACILAGLALRALTTWAALGGMLVWTGSGPLAAGALMVLSSRVGKLRARDRLLDRLTLRGDERVLDVGCGHGLLLIGAATRVPRGHATGVDLWSQTDQHDNSREATLANARAEGVAERVTVADGDMRRLPFPGASFDAVVSSLAVHNVPDRGDRRAAIGEMVRVLAPGGRIALTDIAHVGEYASDLRAAGMRDVRVSAWSPWIFPPARTVTARK
ncbi:MAG: class I SAM-dependent methyltransferase [Gemmatimonadaceae bacterium]